MRTFVSSLVGALAVLTTPLLAHAAPVWIGDFETGDLSQWEGLLNQQVGGVDYITVVDDVVVQGTYAARIELHNDAAWDNGLKRVELNHSPPPERTAEGATTYFAWSFYLPETLPEDPPQNTGYWESHDSYQSLMVWDIVGTRMSFTTRRPDYVLHWQDDAAATPGEWHRIAARVLWSADPAVGEVDVWFDGVQVVDAAQAATLADANWAFTQIGLIRDAIEFADVPVIYIDDAVEGDSLEDVHPDPMGSSDDGGSSSAGSSDGSGADTSTSTSTQTSGGSVSETSGGEVGSGSTTTSGASDASSGESSSAGASERSSGCACTTNEGAPARGLALLLFVALTARRSRAAACRCRPSRSTRGPRRRRR
jgi:MYXO-CTERM domain-containing protein